MATIHKNLSEIGTELPSAADMRIGIVVSEWNEQITGALLEGAVRTLKNAGCDEQNIEVKRVPGTFELSLGATPIPLPLSTTSATSFFRALRPSA